MLLLLLLVLDSYSSKFAPKGVKYMTKGKTTLFAPLLCGSLFKKPT